MKEAKATKPRRRVKVVDYSKRIARLAEMCKEALAADLEAEADQYETIVDIGDHPVFALDVLEALKFLAPEVLGDSRVTH